MKPSLNTLILITVLGAGASATASPVVRSGDAIHLRVAGHREAGRALRADSDGWPLKVDAEDAVAELTDVTANATPDKWVVAVRDGRVHLDAARFRAGHAYRVEVRRGIAKLESTFVYLSPPRGKGAAKVIFDGEERENSSDEIAIAPKSAL